jgi:uncharacterized membrane protein YfcA
VQLSLSSALCLAAALAATFGAFTLNDKAEATLASALAVGLLLVTLRLAGSREFAQHDEAREEPRRDLKD